MIESMVEFFVALIGVVVCTFVALTLVVIVAAVLTGLWLAIVRAVKNKG